MRSIARRGISFGVSLLVWALVVLPVVATPPLQEGQTVHVVQAGETLSAISQRYGVTINAIVTANGLADPDRLSVGQRLVIPGVPSNARPTTLYVVQPGDTLALVTRRYGVDARDVAQLNHLANPNLIYVGQRLMIPTQGAEGSRDGRGQVHIVQAGETMAGIATRYGMTVWAMAQANGITNPNVIQVGQRLLIPTADGQSSLPLPFLSVQIIPPLAVQGQTVRVVVETEGEADLTGDFNGNPLPFVGEGGRYRTLFGVHAMASPGPYALDLVSKQGGSSEERTEKTITVHNLVQVVPGTFDVQYLTFSGEKAALLQPELLTAEANRLWEITTQVTFPGLWQGLFRLPLANASSITAPFGIRRSYGGPPDSYHSGVDYDAPEGTPVMAPARGKVVLAEALTVRGNAVVVDHGRGVMTGYWHLSRIDVSPGQQVEAGDVLGAVGTTGLSTGPHLHWELRVMGIQVEPLQWVREQMQ